MKQTYKCCVLFIQSQRIIWNGMILKVAGKMYIPWPAGEWMLEAASCCRVKLVTKSCCTKNFLVIVLVARRCGSL